MKICIFTRSLPIHNTGGMELHCWRVACGFAEKGHQVDIITTAHPQKEEEENLGCLRIHYIKNTKPGKYSLRWRKESLRKMWEIHSEKRIDIIYSESSGALSYLREKSRLSRNSFQPMITQILKRLRRFFLRVFSARGGSTFGGNLCNLPPHADDVLEKKRGKGEIPVVLRLPGTALQEAISKIYQPLSLYTLFGFLKNFFHFFRDRRLYPYADALIACSYEVASALRNELNMPSEKIHTILNGVDVESFHPNLDVSSYRDHLKISKDTKIILCVSRIKKEKGIHILIRVFKNIQSHYKVKLLIIGDGSYLYYLKALSRKLNVEHKVLFLGHISKEELPPYYVLADIVVLPTITREGLPHTVLEAMACAHPVIATDIGGIPSAITDGIDGFLIKKGDTKQLESKIALLLDNPQLCKRLGQKAQEKVFSKFLEQRMVEETLSVLERCVRYA